jgi:hypothetical protein
MTVRIDWRNTAQRLARRAPANDIGGPVRRAKPRSSVSGCIGCLEDVGVAADPTCDRPAVTATVPFCRRHMLRLLLRDLPDQVWPPSTADGFNVNAAGSVTSGS